MLPIDFYFDFASPYGFLAAMQIDALAERAGRTVRWRPFLLGAVYKQVEQSPLDHPPKRDYVNNVDAPRCARLLALTLQRPRGWPEHALPPSRIFYWLDRDDSARAADYARAAYRKYWLSGESTADPDAAADVAAALGHNRADALAAMQDIAVKQRVIDANDAAVARGVFGSPFFFVDDEPFWGSDRLSHMPPSWSGEASDSPDIFCRRRLASRGDARAWLTTETSFVGFRATWAYWRSLRLLREESFRTASHHGESASEGRVCPSPGQRRDGLKTADIVEKVGFDRGRADFA